MSLLTSLKTCSSYRDLTRNLDTTTKNKVLADASTIIENSISTILSANKKDVNQAMIDGLSASFIDRLTLTEGRIKDMSASIRTIASLEDPVNRLLDKKVLANGLILEKISQPMGCIGIIYEARPNVTSDCAALCFKAGSTCFLKGGKEAYHSCKAIVNCLQAALINNQLPKEIITLAPIATHEQLQVLMEQRQYLDLLIPRGSKALIESVVNNAKVPVIETGAGVCHLYVDKDADINEAIDIMINAKVQRPSVCNAIECMLVHQDIVDSFMPAAIKALKAHNVVIKAEKKLHDKYADLVLASGKDFGYEFSNLTLAIKQVSDIDEAIKHITKYGTKHSECIVTNNQEAIDYFMKHVDAAVVYSNASTRFSDGGVFELGAEIGISTQKLHARGPMGLEALCTYTTRVYGKGQVRE